ncbi:hypothetical protein Scep_010039 [Stephania cephalantha]|uniref:Uncharacterized protein n=1 Tax=Stephania cephalantha TaxID=152367 RepID=A0AAP0JVM9_9MAGN
MAESGEVEGARASNSSEIKVGQASSRSGGKARAQSARLRRSRAAQTNSGVLAAGDAEATDGGSRHQDIGEEIADNNSCGISSTGGGAASTSARSTVQQGEGSIASPSAFPPKLSKFCLRFLKIEISGEGLKTEEDEHRGALRLESLIVVDTCLGWVVMLARIILYGESRAWLLEGLPLKLMNFYYCLSTTFGKT